MNELVDNPLAYLIIISLVALSSLLVCIKLNPQRITAERAFWGVWIFLIMSAETVTNFDLFNYPYQIDSITRQYTLELFLTSAIAFISATFITSLSRKKIRVSEIRNKKTEKWRNLTKRRKLIISIFFLTIGVTEFAVNYSVYGNLLDLRLGSLEETHVGFQGYLYIFYFAHAYLLLLGYIDGSFGKTSKTPVYFTVAALIFHNLSIGGRINVLVAPLYYVISYMLCISKKGVYGLDTYYQARSYFVKMMAFIFFAFSVIGILRTLMVDFGYLTTFEGIANKVIFAVPKYISDAYVSISIHAGHALSAEPLFGKFTFDALYRLFLHLGIAEPIDPNLFGHSLYQDTPDPWAWTQTNVIPRLVADFGDSFYLVIYFYIAFLSQWISITMSGRDFFRNSIATMAIICSLYTIQAAMWFSAYTIIILSCCILIDKTIIKAFMINKIVLNRW